MKYTLYPIINIQSSTRQNLTFMTASIPPYDYPHASDFTDLRHVKTTRSSIEIGANQKDSTVIAAE